MADGPRIGADRPEPSARLFANLPHPPVYDCEVDAGPRIHYSTGVFPPKYQPVLLEIKMSEVIR